MQLEVLFANFLGEPIEAITDETSPRNTRRWDSMRHIDLVMAVESTYGIQFSMPEMTSLHSVRDVRRLLQQKGIAV